MSDFRNDLNESVLTAITHRQKWEMRMVQFYQMRHNGIRRRNKPWPTASDLHWPLIDTNIEKLKPLFFQQIVGMDTVATFVPMVEQIQQFNSLSEQWFDYKVRECSNLQSEALSWIDYTLMFGRGIIKIYWDSQKKQVCYTAVDPQYFIVPQHTKDLQDADWMVHVIRMSTDAYRRSTIYKNDKATMEAIRGSGENSEDAANAAKVNERNIREGLTHLSNNDGIIIWEVYQKTVNGWNVFTYSPVKPELDLRDPMQLPYDHGQAPFVDFPYEVKDKGWYSPRGIAEILAPYELSLCNTWNHKHDAMALFNNPTFSSSRDIPNSINIRAKPGQILPYGLTPTTMPQPPISWDQEMVQARSVAEARVANPDYGMGQVINTSNRRTATEIEAIGTQSQANGDLRARIFRLALGQVYKQHWALLLQYDKEDLRFRFLSNSLQVDPLALHKQYHIEPKGGANEVNKQFIFGRFMGYKQAFKDSPWIDMSQIDKAMLALNDPELVSAAFKDPNLKKQSEAEDETRGIPSLVLGNNLPVNKGEDYPTRIGVLLEYIQSTQKNGQQMPPQAQQVFVGRLDNLLTAYAQQDNNGALKMRTEVGKYLQSIGWMPSQQQGPQPQIQRPQPQVAA